MILVFEPECKGFAHEQVNAAVVANLLQAGHEVHLMAEAEHIECIKGVIGNDTLLSQLSSEAVAIPKRSSIFLKQLLLHQKLAKLIKKRVSELPISQIVFLSINEVNLISAKLLALKIKQKISIFVHGILECFSDNNWNPFEYKTFFKMLLKLHTPKNLDYIAISHHIQSTLIKKHRAIAKQFTFLYHPYLFNKNSDTVDSTSQFSYIGAFHEGKGAKELLMVAEKLLTIKSNASIRIIGYNGTPEICPSNIISPYTDRRLSCEEMQKEIRASKYLVFTYPLHMYNYMASGALFDAFQHEKPIIVLKHPMFEHYFDTFGNIGYLCKTVEEFAEKLNSLAKEENKETYQEMVSTIKNAKETTLPLESKRFFQEHFPLISG